MYSHTPEVAYSPKEFTRTSQVSIVVWPQSCDRYTLVVHCNRFTFVQVLLDHGKDVFDKQQPAPHLLILTSSGDRRVATAWLVGVVHMTSRTQLSSSPLECTINCKSSLLWSWVGHFEVGKNKQNIASTTFYLCLVMIERRFTSQHWCGHCSIPSHVEYMYTYMMSCTCNDKVKFHDVRFSSPPVLLLWNITHYGFTYIHLTHYNTVSSVLACDRRCIYIHCI